MHEEKLNETFWRNTYNEYVTRIDKELWTKNLGRNVFQNNGHNIYGQKFGSTQDLWTLKFQKN